MKWEDDVWGARPPWPHPCAGELVHVSGVAACVASSLRAGEAPAVHGGRQVGNRPRLGTRRHPEMGLFSRLPKQIGLPIMWVRKGARDRGGLA